MKIWPEPDEVFGRAGWILLAFWICAYIIALGAAALWPLP